MSQQSISIEPKGDVCYFDVDGSTLVVYLLIHPAVYAAPDFGPSVELNDNIGYVWINLHRTGNDDRQASLRIK
jgi:hypothetical protein